MYVIVCIQSAYSAAAAAILLGVLLYLALL